jgi:hypothetical protein
MCSRKCVDPRAGAHPHADGLRLEAGHGLGDDANAAGEDGALDATALPG